MHNHRKPDIFKPTDQTSNHSTLIRIASICLCQKPSGWPVRSWPTLCSDRTRACTRYCRYRHVSALHTTMNTLATCFWLHCSRATRISSIWPRLANRNPDAYYTHVPCQCYTAYIAESALLISACSFARSTHAQTHSNIAWAHRHDACYEINLNIMRSMCVCDAAGWKMGVCTRCLLPGKASYFKSLCCVVARRVYCICTSPKQQI